MAFSIWEFIRAAGLTSFFLLFVSVCAGLLLSNKVSHSKVNKYLQLVHQSTGWYSLLFGFFHGLLLFINQYEPYTLVEIFIPFMTNEHQILNGIGTLSLYIFILLFLSVDLMKKIGATVWKKIHRLALPAFILVSIHGILLGTDTKEVWAIILYTSSLAAIFALLIVKLLIPKNKANKVESL